MYLYIYIYPRSPGWPSPPIEQKENIMTEIWRKVEQNQNNPTTQQYFIAAQQCYSLIVWQKVSVYISLPNILYSIPLPHYGRWRKTIPQMYDTQPQ